MLTCERAPEDALLLNKTAAQARKFGINDNVIMLSHEPGSGWSGRSGQMEPQP